MENMQRQAALRNETGGQRDTAQTEGGESAPVGIPLPDLRRVCIEPFVTSTISGQAEGIGGGEVNEFS